MWKQKEYDLVYKNKGGKVANMKVLAGQKIAPIAGPNTLKNFSHWNTKKTGRGDNYYSGEKKRAPLVKSILYAQFKKKYYFVFFAGIQTDRDQNYDYFHKYIQAELKKKAPNSEMYALTIYPFHLSESEPFRGSNNRQVADSILANLYLDPTSNPGKKAYESIPKIIKDFINQKSIDETYLIGYSGGGIVSTVVSEKVNVTGNFTVASPNVYVEKGKEKKTKRLYGEKNIFHYSVKLLIYWLLYP